MNDHISERRIRNNKLRRKRQMHRNISMLFMTVVLTAGFSTMLFSFKAKAQSNVSSDISYKYYKSVTIGAGDTIWDFADLYADTEYYDSYDSYIKEVMAINHLKNETIIYGQNLIIPYYSNEFIG